MIWAFTHVVLVRVLEKLFKSFEYEYVYDKGETPCFMQQS